MPAENKTQRHRGATIDFERVAKSALALAGQLVPEWLPGGCREGHEWVALNPTRADRNPGSFRINLKTGEWCDHATGDHGTDLTSLRAYLDGSNQVEAAIALAGMLGVDPYKPQTDGVDGDGVTLEAYAAAKALDVERLRALGLRTITMKAGRKALVIPYRKRDGSHMRDRLRLALGKGDGARFAWGGGKDGPVSLYGLDKLPLTGCPVFLVEGESDCHALWQEGWDACGVPTGSGYRPDRDDDELDGLVIIALLEPDKGGEKLARALSQSRLRPSIRAVWFADVCDIDGVKDASDLLIREQNRFPDVMRWIIDHATSLDELLKQRPDLDALTKPEAGDAPPAEAKPSGEFERTPLPNGFRYMRDGWIEYLTKEATGEGDTEWVWKRLCSPVEFLAETRDVEGTGWGLLLRVKTREGFWHTRAFPRAMMLTQSDDFMATLVHLGLRFDDVREVRNRLKLFFSRVEADALARVANRVGWHGDRLFVLPDEAFGERNGDHVIFSPDRPLAHNYRTKGTVGGWKNEVAARCVGNSRLAFATSAAFAPPMLAPLRMESGGFHFRGASSIGKTSTLFVAGSVWGGNDNSDIGFAYTWRGTDNGIESKAVNHSDALLPLDEIQQVHGEVASKIVYTLANGQGKARASQKGDARPSAEWRLLFLSTGEVSLAAKLAEAGMKTMAGQETRFIDLEADAGGGFGTFEDLHGLAGGAAFSKAIKEACKSHYGHAAREFLRRLTADVEGAREAAGKLAAEFTARVCPAHASGQVYRVAERFALVAAAGTLATRWGILPWPAQEAAEAAESLFLDWLKRRGSAGALEGKKALEQVRAMIEKHGASRFVPWDLPSTLVMNRLGFVRQSMTNDDSVRYYVFPEAFKEEFCKGMDVDRVVKALQHIGAMASDGGGKSSINSKYPGGGRNQKRFYIIDEERLFADNDETE